MVRMICFILLALVACSCRSAKYATCNNRDSTRIEVRTQTILVPDTVYLEIPVQTAERTTRDSTSHLENDYAVSDARINADGTLYHDLRTKPQRKPVPTEKAVERRDSVVYVNRDIEVPIPIEKSPGWWEQTCIKWFPYTLGAIVLLLCLVFRKPLLAIVRRFI